MTTIHRVQEQPPGWLARRQLVDLLTREVMQFTDEAAQIAVEEQDAVVSILRSTVRILVRTVEDRRLAETVDRGNRNCVRCSGGPYQFCACTQDCGFFGCQWGNEAARRVTTGDDGNHGSSCMRCSGAGVTCACTQDCGSSMCSAPPF